MSNILKRMLDIKAEIKALEEEYTTLRDESRITEPGDYVVDDDFRLVVTPTRRFSPRLAKALLTDEEYAKILKQSPDGTLVKSKLGMETYEQLMEVKGLTFSFKERDDRE